TLDSKQRKLQPGTLMICDAEKPVAIAGVMGGENSEINSKTKNLLIESAYFNPTSIRRTSRALGLSTDASYRFERGTDPSNTLYAAQKAAHLISELGFGKIANGHIDVYPNKISPRIIDFRINSVERILGYKVASDRIIKILSSLGFEVNEKLEDYLKVAVPSFRPDIEREIDIIEEIARIHGYDNIPTISKISVTLQKRVDETEFEDRVRNIANSLGFYEMINNPLVNLKMTSWGQHPIRILNPQNMDMEYLRNSLLPSALSVIARNINSSEKDLRLFEIGKIFYKTTQNQLTSFSDFIESQKLLFIITGNVNLKEWYSNERFCDFFDLKGDINSFLSQISLDYSANDSYYHEGNNLFEYRLTKSIDNKVLGEGGKVKKEVLQEFGIEQDVFAFEFDVSSLINVEKKSKRFTEPSKFPKIRRDFAFVLDKNITVDRIINHIKNKSSNLLTSVKLFDVYEGEAFGSGKRSLAFALEYSSTERTLKEIEVEQDFTSLIKSISETFNAVLRGI
ncbi:MAG: phenylalanine--tRNA ligase subunit beta, partial [Ignavibacteriaceae bacterium]|nr:phenylalanine--tRNA ligase subunit beta [Ignavibacteriaceae bacterium]